MNREQLITHWEVIEEFKNGKDIQRQGRGDPRWFDDPDPTFHIDFNYRVKPEPVEYWANIYSDRIRVHKTENIAKSSKGCNAIRVAVHLVEKTE